MTHTKDEALKLALEALEEAIKLWREEMEYRSCIDAADSWEKTSIAIKQALLTATPLAAPVQEPLTDEHIERIYHRYGGDMINCARAIERAAQPAPVKDLPFGVGGAIVAVKTLLSRDPCVHANTAIEMLDAILATPSAAQRQWVGLTKTVAGNYLRRHQLGDQPTFRQGFKEGMAFAEAKLKEKNT